MFGKKAEKGPTMEQRFSSLELKMNVVEILLERNEEDLKEKFILINEKVENQANDSEKKIFEISESLKILTKEIQTLRSGFYLVRMKMV